MTTTKNSRNWVLASAVAAMLAASVAGVRAQDTATPPAAPAPMTPDATGTTPAATTTTTDTTGTMSSGMSSTSMMPMSGLDYSLLSNPNYNHVDIQKAKAAGYSDSEVATIAKIAEKTGWSFSAILAQVEAGQSFPILAAKYNLSLADVYDVDKQKADIAAYEAAYATTGTKGMMSSGAMMSTPSTMPMAPSTPSTPPTAMTPSTPAPMTPMPMATSSLDVVDTISAAKNLTTLAKALQVAGLVETLKGAGPFTVFAPDDKAFSRLPAGQLDALMADPARLKTILTYHVLPASVTSMAAKSMSDPTSPPTVEGSTLQVTKGRHGKLKINDATVQKADIAASNGIVHIIDRVLMPPDLTPAASSTDTTGTPGAATPPGPTSTTAPAPTSGMPSGTTPTPAPAAGGTP